MKPGSLLVRVALAACCGLAIESQFCLAQTGAGMPAPVVQPSFQSSWEQRVLGNSVSAGLQPQVWGPVENVSTTSEMGPTVIDQGQEVGQMELMPDGMEIGPDATTMVPGGCESCEIGLECTSCSDPCGGCGVGPCGVNPWFNHLSLTAGVQGFKGPVDRGINGNFGFHQGVNWSAPVGQCTALAYQIGFRAVQSDIEGDQVAYRRTQDRDQWFLTAGIFQRAPCGGWQWGIVFDYLNDRYYYGDVNLGQLRTEVSWAHGSLWEFGFWGALGVKDGHGTDPTTVLLRPTDLYTFFYRQHFPGGGNARLWAGFSGQSDGLVGADLAIPLGGGWALENNFNYLIPDQSSELGGQTEESWGLGISLVWYPGREAGCEMQSPHHSLFRVADNSLFMVDFQ